MDALWRYNITFIHVHIILYPPFLQICLRVTTSLFFPLGLVHTAQFTPVTTQLSLPKRANKFHLKHQKPKLEVALSFKEEFHSHVLVHGEVADVYHGFRRMKRSLKGQAPVTAQVLWKVWGSCPCFLQQGVSSDIILVKGHTEPASHCTSKVTEERSNIPHRPPMTPPLPHHTSALLSCKYTELQKLSSLGT